MKRVVIFIFCFTLSAYADISLKNALFANIIHVKSDDTLNVRAKADYKSKKITELGYNIVVGLSGKCKKSGKSTWCKVYELAAYGDDKEGWVNAYYLKPYSEGFVTLNGYKNNCYYALKCANRKGKVECLVILDKEKKAQWIARDQLRGESQFGAAHQNMEGYCTKGAWVESYLKEYHQTFDSAKDVVDKLLEVLEEPNAIEKIAQLIDPKRGITLTEMVAFGDKDEKHFSKNSFLSAIQKNDKLFLGYTYAKGDKIFRTLIEYLDAIHREKEKVTKIVSLENLKGFSLKGDETLKALEVYWIDESSKTKEYDYLGMVVIVSHYKGKWYLVGLLRDRWTI